MDLKTGTKKTKAKKRVYSEYKCEKCSKQFTDKASLLKHQPTHSDETPYACELCAYAGKTQQYLRRHIKVTHERDRKFECNVCGKTFHFGCKLKDHMRVHTGEKPYKCSDCDKAFNSSYSLNTHKLIHTDSKPFQCSFCPYACRDSSTLRKHQARHMGLVTYYKCSMCNVSCTSKANLKLHVAEKHFDVDVHKMECDACGKRFKFRNALVNHIRAVHEKSTRAKCEICGLVISNKHNMRYHMRIHVDLKPFVCTVEGCEKRYKHTSSLQKHIVCHYPERQFPCHICERRFPREKRMRAHLKTHAAKVKNVECGHCGVCFYNKTYLTTHIRRKHGRRRQRFACDQCGFETTNKPSIVMHIKYGHVDKAITCTICEKKFKRDFNLKLHYWMAHEMEYEIPTRRKKSKKAKRTVVQVKEEPVENMYHGEEYFQVSPKIEPLDAEALEELNLAAAAQNHNGLEDIPKEMFEDFITPVVKGRDEDRRRRHSQDGFVDKISEEQVNKEVNSIMERMKQKTAARALERARRKYNKLIRRAIKVNTREAHKRRMHRKNKKQNSNSLLEEDFSINQTIDNKDCIVDKATIENTEQGIDNIEEKEGNTKDNGTEDIEECEKDVEENGLDIDNTGVRRIDKDIIYDAAEEVNENKDTEMKLGQNRKLKINTYQCYVCFKLYQTKEELLEHCKDHFELCNVRTLKKCPLCDYATNLSVTTHLKRKHNLTVKVPYGSFKDNKDNDGSRYYYEVSDERIKKVEIIPSIKNLNKRESNKIDKKKRENKNKAVVKNKLIKKGKEWIVTTEKIKINDYLLPKFDKLDSKNVKSGYLDRLKELYQVAKKEGKKMLFPCDSCEKICQTLSALKLHGRKHEANPKPFKPKVWKHKNKTQNDANDVLKTNNKSVTISRENRVAQPKPVVNKHKCDKELIDFYERNIRGGDIEFWQFLKIYNKMGRENVNDFDDLQKSTQFGLHCNEPVNTNNNALTAEDSVEHNRNVSVKNTNRVKKTAKHAFTRVVRLSKREMMKREEAKRRLREKIRYCNSENSNS